MLLPPVHQGHVTGTKRNQVLVQAISPPVLSVCQNIDMCTALQPNWLNKNTEVGKYYKSRYALDSTQGSSQRHLQVPGRKKKMHANTMLYSFNIFSSSLILENIPVQSWQKNTRLQLNTQTSCCFNSFQLNTVVGHCIRPSVYRVHHVTQAKRLKKYTCEISVACCLLCNGAQDNRIHGSSHDLCLWSLTNS